jgi:hypothetical protein
VRLLVYLPILWYNYHSPFYTWPILYLAHFIRGYSLRNVDHSPNQNWIKCIKVCNPFCICVMASIYKFSRFPIVSVFPIRIINCDFYSESESDINEPGGKGYFCDPWMQWRSQTIIFGRAYIERRRRNPFWGGSGGILPRENFEIWSPSMAISRVSGERFCIILKIIYCRKDLIFNHDFSITWILNLTQRSLLGRVWIVKSKF